MAEGYIASTSVQVAFEVDQDGLRRQLDEASRQKVDITAAMKLDDAQLKADLAKINRQGVSITATMKLNSATLKADLAAISRDNLSLTAALKLDDRQAKAELAKFSRESATITAKIRLDTSAAKADMDKLIIDLKAKALGSHIKMDVHVNNIIVEREAANLSDHVKKLFKATAPTLKPLFKGEEGESKAKDFAEGINRLFGRIKAHIVPRINNGFLRHGLSDMTDAVDSAATDAGKSGGQAMASALSSSTIFLVAGIVAAVVLALAVLPASLALVGAAGGIALGTALADKASKSFQKEFAGLKSDVKGAMHTAGTEAAQAFAGPFAQVGTIIKHSSPNLGKEFGDVFKAVAPDIVPFTRMLTELVGSLLPGITVLLKAAVGPINEFSKGAFKVVASNLGKFFKELAPAVGPSMVVFGHLLVVFSDIIVALGAVSVAVAKAMAWLVKFNLLKTIAGWADFVSGSFQKMGSQVSGAVASMVRYVIGSFNDMKSQVAGAATGVWHDVTGAFATGIHDIESFTDNMRHNIASSWDGLRHDTASIVSGSWHDVESFFSGGMHNLEGAVANFRHSVASDWDGLRHDTASIVSGSWHDVVGFFSSGIHSLESAAGSMRHNIASTWDATRHDVASTVSGLWHDVESTFSNGIHAVESAASSLFHGLESGFAATVHGVASAWDGIKNAVDAPVKFIVDTVYDKGIVRFWNDVAGAVGLPKLKPLSFERGGIVPGDVPLQMAGGGMVAGGIHGMDSVSAVLAPGELVIPAQHAPKYAAAAKADGVPIGPGYARGGVVEGFAGGGIPNPITAVQHAGSAVLHGAENVGKAIAGGASNLIKLIASKGASAVLNTIVNPLVNKIPSGKSEISQLPKDMVKKLVSSIASTVTSHATATGGPNGGPLGGATGSEMANGRELYNYLLKNVFGGNKTAAAGATASIWGECVTLDHMILTRRGWLKHDEVHVGDETLGYNPATGKSEWTRITRVVHYANREVVRYGNQYWSATFTPNHRWLTQGVGRERFYDEDGCRRERQVESAPSLLPWNEKDDADRLVLAMPADTGTGLPITDREAALLGWIAGDGGLTPGGACVYQSKPQHFAAIEDALADVEGVTLNTRDRVGRRNAPGYGKVTLPERIYRLPAAYTRDLLTRAGNPKTEAERQVRDMSESQRGAWLNAMYAAEGSPRTGGRTYYQNEGNIADAIELAVYLSGHRPGVCKTRGNELAITDAAPYVGGYKRRSFTEPAGRADVWCVATELGSWTTRNDSGVFLTGNSTWNPFAVGTGGRGLIGWTPVGTISDSAFSGGMATQLPAIIKFISSSGDWGVINQMKSAGSVSQAAWEWGRGVERFGIPDVHPQGLSLASSFMAQGGIAGGKPHSAGGMISEPVYGFGANSGIPYSFAEHGPEQIIPGGQARGNSSGSGDPVSARLLQQILIALQTGNQISRQIPFRQAQASRAANSAGLRHGVTG